MKFYSEVTKKLYDNEQDLAKAEKIVKEEEAKKEKLKLEKADRKSEVDSAFDKFVELKNKYMEDYNTSYCYKGVTYGRNSNPDFVTAFFQNIFR